jgi:hypothetical protein
MVWHVLKMTWTRIVRLVERLLGLRQVVDGSVKTVASIGSYHLPISSLVGNGSRKS